MTPPPDARRRLVAAPAGVLCEPGTVQDTGGAAPLLARVLVGRDGELDVLRGAWRAGGTVRVVRGPAGIGKSRLVRELGAWASARGGAVLVGRATAAARATPLRPIREALLGAARRGLRPAEDLAPLVPALAALVPDWGDGATPAPESSLLLGEATLRLLASLAGDGTAALVVEDLQWADPETLAVVEYLADNVDGWPVLVVATVRDGEPGDGTDLAAALVRRRVAAEITLAPLSAEAVVTMGRACLAEDGLPAEVVEALVARSEGIPFLVEELVATAVGAGWDTVAAAVPGSVVASVAVRLDGLPPAARPLLEAAALLGRSFDWTVAARAAGLADEVAADLLRQAVRVQLVDVEGAEFRFHHALTRDAVLSATPPSALDLLARRALDALDAGGPLDGDRALLAAELADRTGQPDRAAALLVEAARHALGAGALASADLFATRARALATGERADEVDEVLLRVSVLAGHTERAATLGESLLARRGEPAAQADLHLLLGSAALAAGAWGAASDHASAAGALDPSDAARGARASALAAQAAMGRDDIDDALRAARAALEGARATGQPEVQCEALEVLGRAERGRDLAAAEAAFSEALETASGAGLALWRVRALQELGTVDMFGSLDLRHLEAARREAEALGALATVAVVDLQLAAVHDERGELDLALAAARRCEDASRRWHLATLPMSLTVQGMVHARTGARAEMDAAMAAALATGEDSDYVEISIWGNARPIAELIAGDLAAATGGLDRAMDVIRRRPGAALPVPGLWALVRTLLDDGGDAARAEVDALAFDTPVSRWMAAAAGAVALGRAGDAGAAAARFADADAALARQHGGFRRALVRLLVAPAAHADGWGDPVTWLRESLATSESLGLDAMAARCRSVLRDVGAAVPRRKAAGAIVPPALAGLGITAREVDVLVLVAGGATNREVAERLFISPRTVDKHVERLLMKTGTSRAGLGAVAADAGLLRT